MRVLLLAAALLVGAAAGPAAADSIRLVPRPADGQALDTRDGQLRLVSPGVEALATLSAGSEVLDDGGQPTFVLAFGARGKAPVWLPAARLTASTEAGPVPVLTVADLAAAARRRAEVRAKDSQFRRMGPKAYSAGAFITPEGYETRTHIYGAGSDTQVLIDARAAGPDQLAADLEAARANGFRPVAANPGESAATAFTLAALPAGATSLSVTAWLNGEVHSFRYQIEPAP